MGSFSSDHAASLRSPSQSVRNPTTWFQLGIIRDAGPEITNGLGALLYAAGTNSLLARVAALAHFVAFAVEEPKRHGV
jgi:hypothetical protein